ncbi:hypothetical protein C0V82_11440 [Niveispirillum cyanobacteriorum]|uniref:Uncharacterized protein n=1 Tax=Niveispirillum cyanobacteriorum TaxID=1612173 RepID=A0A2K9NF00_9PROT|nr:hypothetical protein C0V82_11440 [Niveispirillum cyanobacteriorum]
MRRRRGPPGARGPKGRRAAAACGAGPEPCGRNRPDGRHYRRCPGISAHHPDPQPMPAGSAKQGPP